MTKIVLKSWREEESMMTFLLVDFRQEWTPPGFGASGSKWICNFCREKMPPRFGVSESLLSCFLV